MNVHHDDCGECVYCVDMKKFGGPGRKKKCCLKRRYNSQKVSTNPVAVDGKERCHPTSKDHVFSEPKCLLEQGRKVYVIKGDGNCMFRAISYLMTGDEENYARTRLLLQRFEYGAIQRPTHQCKQTNNRGTRFTHGDA